MSFEPRRSSSARGSGDGRRSLRPSSGRDGSATPSAYAGVGVRAVSSTPSHLHQREFQFSFDPGSIGARDREPGRAASRASSERRVTSTAVRTTSARRSKFGVSPSVPSSVRPAERSVTNDGSSFDGTRSTARTNEMHRVPVTSTRSASARASGRPAILVPDTDTNTRRVGFGTHISGTSSRPTEARPVSSSFTSASEHAHSARRDAYAVSSSRSSARPTNTRPSTSTHTRSSPSRNSSPPFSPTMSTEGAIAAAYRRARGDYADAQDLVDEEVEEIKAQRPSNSNSMTVSRKQATSRLHRGLPTSPGTVDRRPSSSISRMDSLTSSLQASSPRSSIHHHRSLAVSAARDAAAAARSRAVDPAGYGSSEHTRVDTTLRHLPVRPQSGNPKSGAGIIAGVREKTAPLKPPPHVAQHNEKNVHWAPSPSPAQQRRVVSAAPQRGVRVGGVNNGTGTPHEPPRKQPAPPQNLHYASGLLTRDDDELFHEHTDEYVQRHQAERQTRTEYSLTRAESMPVERTDINSKITQDETVLPEKPKPLQRAQSALPVMRVGDVDDRGALPGYVLGPVIGEGGFCKVRSGIHQVSGATTAVKLIDKTSLKNETDRKRVGREIRVLKKLNHRNVVRLFDVVETAKKIFCVMEYAAGGSVLDYVRSKRSLTEDLASKFTGQIIEALSYCHSNWIVHRDVKLENLLLDFDKRRVLLIDFGLSAVFQPGKKLTVHCGSPSYAAPEIVSRKPYDGPPVDVWSLGVVSFAMVTGYLPFHARGGDKRELCRKIISGTYSVPDKVSNDFKEFVGVVLRVDVEKRATLVRCRDSRWVRSGGGSSGYSSNGHFGGSNNRVDTGRGHSARSHFHDENNVGAKTGVTYPSTLTGNAVDQGRVDSLVAAGIDRESLVRNLQSGEHNYTTAAYHLLAYRDASASFQVSDVDVSVCKQSRARSARLHKEADISTKHQMNGRLPVRPQTAMYGKMQERRADAAATAETLRRLNL